MGDIDAAANAGSWIPAAGCVAARRGARGVTLAPDGGTRSVSHRGVATERTVASRQAPLGGQGICRRRGPRRSSPARSADGGRAVRRGCRGDPPADRAVGYGRRQTILAAAVGSGCSGRSPGSRSAAPLRFRFTLARRVIAAEVQLSRAPMRRVTNCEVDRQARFPRDSRSLRFNCCTATFIALVSCQRATARRGARRRV